MEKRLTPSQKFELHRYLRMHRNEFWDASEMANDFMYLNNLYGEDLYNEIVEYIENYTENGTRETI